MLKEAVMDYFKAYSSSFTHTHTHTENIKKGSEMHTMQSQ
jgi:hypothetical protein